MEKRIPCFISQLSLNSHKKHPEDRAYPRGVFLCKIKRSDNLMKMKRKETVLAGGIIVYCAHDEIVAIDKIMPNPKNPNTHSQEQIKLLARIIAEQGWRQPITVSTLSGLVVKGHGRLLAAQYAHLEEVPVDYQDYASEAAEYADLIADNRIAEFAEIDDKLLATMLQSIWDADGDFDIALSGYSDEEYANLLENVNGGGYSQEAHEDDYDEPDDLKGITKRGDLWQIGKHRLYCGDSTCLSDAEFLMRDDNARMCFTDPPWNVAIGQDSNPRHRQWKGLENDSMSYDDFKVFLTGFIGAFEKYIDGDLYCVLGASEWPLLDNSLREHGYHWSATIIWVKDVFVLGRSKYHKRYEPIWYGWHEKKKSSFGKARNKDDVWEIPRPRVSAEHPTMKPIELVANAILNSSVKGDIVIDPFGGSGSTLIACEQTARVCRTMEIDAHYCDVIVDRYIKHNGSPDDVFLVRDGKEISYGNVKIT
jgi:DNA modification methylase